MIKSFSLLLLLLIFSMVLTSCSVPGGSGGTAVCQHRDVNDDSLCDKCSESYTDGKDLVEQCSHRDKDDDNLCDRCDTAYTDGKDVFEACQHRDADDDGRCDFCNVAYTDGKDIPDAPVCQHRDADDNEKCDNCGEDYTDGKDIPDCQHRDADDNEKCDKCGEDYTDGIDLAHTHVYGAWIQYGNAENTPCQNQLFYRTCSSCGGIEWKDGGYENHSFETVTFAPTCQAEGYDEKTCTVCGLVEKVNIQPIADHDYNTTYESNNSFHWLDCKNCDAKDAYAEHTADESGFCITCNAPLAPTEGVVYDVSADGTYAEVIGYTGTATKILIAETYEGLPVKNIYKEVFKNNDTIKQVVIPDSVTSIGSYAFQYCYSLTSVTIGNSVTSIGADAFAWCSSLTSVYIEDIAAWCGIAFGASNANPLYYADNLYLNGELVTDLVIPNSVTSIGNYAFRYCSSLTSVTIGNSVTSIGYEAFYNCSSLTSVTIGNCAAVIRQNAFYGCHSSLYTEYELGRYVGDAENPYAILIGVTNKNLSTYKMHEDTKIIAYGAFYECARMTSIAIPDGVRSIGGYAFYSCDALTSVTIPDSVTSIGNSAFYDCDALTSVTIGNSVTSIDWDAFEYCSALTSVTIPDSVTSIGGDAFYACDSLTSVYYKGDAAEWNAISISSYGNSYLKNATRYYYSEEAPTESGNYWHYDADGKVAVW